jgi:hypothetical protein
MIHCPCRALFLFNRHSNTHFRKVWSATTGDELLSLAHPHVAKGVSFSPDDVRLVWVEECVTGVKGVGCWFFCLLLFLQSSPAQTHLATACQDKLLRIFDASKPSTGRLLHVCLGGCAET